MKKFNLILSLFILFSSVINVYAQDDAENLMQSYMNAMGMGGGNTNAKDSYSFNLMVKMEMNAAGEEKVIMKILLNQSNKDYALYINSTESNEQQNAGFIYDMENNIMVMLGDDGDQKTAIVMPMSDDVDLGDNEYNNDATDNMNAFAYNYNKTGKTKMIAGVSCNQYIYEDSESKVELWTTKKFSFDMKSAFKDMNQVNAFLTGGMLANGFLMELNATDKTNNETYSIKFIEFNEHANEKIDLSDYMMINAG